MRHIFYPAVGPYSIRQHSEGPWRHPTHWMDPEVEETFTPYALLSYALWAKAHWPWEREQHCLLGDSGGYSLVSRQTKIDPERVLRWQIRKCRVGLMLDVPPYRPGSSIQFSGTAAQYWGESLKRSVRNVERCLPTYLESEDFSWWGVIQGETYGQMEEWHGRISEVYPFVGEGEGWALAPKPSTDLLSLTRYLRFARDAGIRRLHILQVTKPALLGVAFSFAKLSGAFDLITYDSATATRCAINRNCVVAHELDFDFLRQKEMKGPVTDYLLSTDHPAARYFQDAYPLLNREFPHYLLLYNHKAMEGVFENVFQASLEDPDRMLRLFGGKRYGKMMREWEGTTTIPKPQYKKVSLFDRL